MRELEWAVVVPVKRLAEAKTRLRGAAIGIPHDQLVLAIAQDTVRAAVACPLVGQVLVITDDPVAAAALGALGARVAPDVPAAGLNAAIAHGAEIAHGAAALPEDAHGGTVAPEHARGAAPLPENAHGAAVAPEHAHGGAVAPEHARMARPPAVRGVAALTADLPALQPAQLASALRAAFHLGRRGFVADAAGTGTTLLAAPPGVAIDPQFGPDSARRHADSGARRLDGPWPSLRRDVDTAEDLAEAQRLGLGPHTAVLLRTLATAPRPGSGPPQSRGSGPAPAPDG